MTTPDQAARSLREAIERQQAAQDTARDVATSIARDRENRTVEGETEEQ